jgi:hypothetical protein
MSRPNPQRILPVVLTLLAGCPAPQASDGPAEGLGPSGLAGLGVLQRIAGLWSGPGTSTPLGDFPIMYMDIRPADPHVLFGRADLSAGNSLRFAFSVETLGGKDTLVYRNGGYFQGLLRDSRAALVAADEAVGSYRFCAAPRGCSYIDANFRFSAPDRLVLDVKVKEAQHLLWTARRLEPRPIPSPFPADLSSQGPGDAPFPPLPTLRAAITWTAPLVADADVWLVLSTSDCSLAASCAISRSFLALAPAGSTRADLALEQIHPGSYKALAVLDRNRNLRTTPLPDSHDGLSLPNTPISISAEGTSITLPIIYDLP